MLQVSNSFKEAIVEPGRSFTTYFYVNGVRVPSQYIFNATIVETGSSEGALKPGEFCRNSITFRVSTEAGDIFRQGSRVAVNISVEGANDVVPLGLFYINECNKVTMYEYEVIGYDLAPSWNDKFAIESSSVQSIINAIEILTGQDLVNKNLLTTTTVTSIPEDTDYMTWLSYIAMLDGYSIRSNRLGDLELYRYNTNFIDFIKPSVHMETMFTITPGEIEPSYPIYQMVVPIPSTWDIDAENIFDGGLMVDDNATFISSYSCYNGEKEIKVESDKGDGYGVTISNPYIKNKYQLARAAKYMWAKYYAMTVKYQGNPALQVGDSITVPEQLTPHQSSTIGLVMKQTFTLDGGFSATIECYSDKAQKEVMPTTPTMRRIEAAANEARNLKEAITGSILDGGSGYYSVIDAEGNVVNLDNKNQPAGWQVTDSEVVTDTTKGWRWILGGLYHSSDGFKTLDSLAITADGYIVCDSIRTGTLRLGGLDNGRGELIALNETGDEVGKLNSDGYVTKASDGETRFRTTVTGGLIQFEVDESWRVDGDWSEEENFETAATIRGRKLGSLTVAPSVLGIEAKSGLSVRIPGFGVHTGAVFDVYEEYASLGSMSTLGENTYDYTIYLDGEVLVGSNLSVSGTKNRLVHTDQYSDRLLYCYETTSPMFGDIGEAVIGDDGLAYIFFDPKFAETIDTYQYQVFLQNYGEGSAVVIDRNASYFVIKGTPGLTVGWEVKGKQADYKQLRLEEYREKVSLSTEDYGTMAIKHIEHIKEERGE